MIVTQWNQVESILALIRACQATILRRRYVSSATGLIYRALQDTRAHRTLWSHSLNRGLSLSNPHLNRVRLARSTLRVKQRWWERAAHPVLRVRQQPVTRSAEILRLLSTVTVLRRS